MQNFWRILNYAKPYKFQIVMAVVFNILMVIFSVFSILMLIPVLKFILKNTQEVVETIPYQGISQIGVFLESQLNFYLSQWIQTYGHSAVLKWVLIVGAIAFILKNVTRYFGSAFLVYMKNGIERDMRTAIHDKILSLPIAAFSETRKGDILARVTNDVLEVQWAILGSIQKLAQDPLMIILTITFMVIMSPQLTLFVIVLIPIMGIIISSIGNSLKKPSEVLKKELGRLVSYLEEHINGIGIIKSFVAENSAKSRFQDANQMVFTQGNRMMYRTELASPISEALGSIIIIAIMWYGGNLILNKGSLEPETFLAYIALFYQIIAPAKNLSKASYDIKRGDASASRIFEILDLPNPLEDQEDAVEIGAFEKEIVFENVSFGYGDKEVIKDFNLTIPKGKTIAFVGQSGSGKSTLANLLNRFYEVEKGRILIDGIDIRKIKKSSLRRLIGFISQEAILFNGSVEENIRFGQPNIDLDDIKNAAQHANASEFLEQLDGDYSYNIGDQGRKLSGGQRQRLTIARAILKNPPIMLLDEATSALDSESEKLVQDAIDRIMKGRTALIIAHRLSTIQYADEIIVMKRGEIMERGNHDTLIQKQGEYYNLVKLQEI
ncbi:MAG: ABC transporter ATP-binding protein/permease [Bacteroidia bacterium]|nr:ABC transporter ATP-binding protein/permease [Bacteroidia bacterium]